MTYKALRVSLFYHAKGDHSRFGEMYTHRYTLAEDEHLNLAETMFNDGDIDSFIELTKKMERHVSKETDDEMEERPFALAIQRVNGNKFAENLSGQIFLDATFEAPDEDADLLDALAEFKAAGRMAIIATHDRHEKKIYLGFPPNAAQRVMKRGEDGLYTSVYPAEPLRLYMEEESDLPKRICKPQTIQHFHLN